VLGLLAAATIFFLTLVELTFDGETISHRNFFKENSFPVSQVETVGMRTFWAGLPGHIFMFVMRSPRLRSMAISSEPDWSLGQARTIGSPR
jgi:hypothetical protein